MKIIRTLFLLALSGIWLAPAAMAAKHKSEIDFRVFGIWESYEPASGGVIQFDMNQTARIYLTKAEGDRLRLRYIDAPFGLSAKDTIQLRYVLSRKRYYRTIKLTFKSENELWLTEKGRVTKYRRVREIPEKYNWQ